MDVLLLLGRFHICRLLWKQINWTETAKNTRYATTEEYEEEYLIVVTVVLLGWFQVIISGKWVIPADSECVRSSQCEIITEKAAKCIYVHYPR